MATARDFKAAIALSYQATTEGHPSGWPSVVSSDLLGSYGATQTANGVTVSEVVVELLKKLPPQLLPSWW